jgi:hypothetical protein
MKLYTAVTIVVLAAMLAGCAAKTCSKHPQPAKSGAQTSPAVKATTDK